MIFDNDFTSLNGGASAIPMDESYNNSYGAALALVEGARNDFKMFNAMIRVEAAACKINESANGVVREGEMQTLQEASIKGIWEKIKALFEKLIAKVKAIVHNFMSKINSLYMKDKDLIKKYRKEVVGKENIGNLEVKWRAEKSGGPSVKSAGWSASDSEDDSDKRKDFYVENGKFEDFKVDSYLEDVATKKISEIGGASGVIDEFESFGKKKDKFDKDNSDIIKRANQAVKDAESAKKKSDDAKPDEVQKANKSYEMATAYQSVVLAWLSVQKQVITAQYKQAKAAFMKMVAANDKKLKESTLLDTIAEAAEQEVEDVIQGAIDSNADATDIGASSVASENVKDGDVSDDPDKNVADYAKGQKKDQVENYEKDKVDGTVDTDYNGKESAFFSELFY